MVETEADYFGNCPVCGALLDTGDLGLMLAHVHDAEIAKARSRHRAKLVAPWKANITMLRRYHRKLRGKLLWICVAAMAAWPVPTAIW
jgi:hypothetical protein